MPHGITSTFGIHPGQQLPLHELFYSVDHRRLVPRSHLQEEVDAYYCAHCLQELTSGEQLHLKGRCGSCFDCPQCLCTLQLQHTIQDERKMWHFACGYCHWDSLTVGLCAERPTDLFNQVIQAEKRLPLGQEIDRLHQLYLEREQAASQILDAQRQGPKERKRLLEKQKQARPKGEAAKVFDPAPEVKRVARTVPSTEAPPTQHRGPASQSPERFHALPGLQHLVLPHGGTQRDPASTWPTRKRLLTRCALRYKDRVLLKPEKPPSVRHQINHCATQFLPAFRIVSGIPEWVEGRETPVHLLASNPNELPSVIRALRVVSTARCRAALSARGIELGACDEAARDDDASNSLPVTPDAAAEDCGAGGARSPGSGGAAQAAVGAGAGARTGVVMQWHHKAILRLRVAPEKAGATAGAGGLSVTFAVQYEFQVEGSAHRVDYLWTLGLGSAPSAGPSQKPEDPPLKF